MGVVQGDGKGTTGADSATPAVFISYASQDTTVAATVVETLERHGVACWIAPRDVKAGALYADAIVRAISGAKALILVLSENSVASPHVSKEIERASSKRRSIITLRIDSAPLSTALEYFLSESQWIDAHAGGMAAALVKLIAATRDSPVDPSATNHLVASAAPAVKAANPRRANRLLLACACVAGALTLGWFLVHGGFWVSPRAVPDHPTAIALPTISEKSIAVLPFVDMSEKKDQEYFSDGMSEELIDMLAKIPNLRVPARTSAFYFKGKPTSIADIAQALRVAYVLEGSVRKSGNTLRVTAQLIRANDGYHVWSETYDRSLSDIFKVQDDVANAVVSALKVSLLGGSLPNATGTQNAEAYNWYLRAKSSRRDYDSDMVSAVEYLRKAVAADPNYADAWALLAGTLYGLANSTSSTPLLEEAKRAAARALTLNPQLPDAHAEFANILISGDLNIPGGEAQIQEALRLDPNYQFSLAVAGGIAAYRGQFDKAIELLQRSISNDPLNYRRYWDLVQILYFSQKYSEALTVNRKMLALNPAVRNNHLDVGTILLAQGDSSGALAEMERADKDERELCGCIVQAYDALGRKVEADAALATLKAKHATDSAYDIALVYATRGEIDQAFEWLERGYRQQPPDVRLLWMKVEPYLKNVRADPRFQTLLKRLHLQEAPDR
jgi:TolB-like protein/cytochrome c-type biogenesis protein CcmH/NrfG